MQKAHEELENKGKPKNKWTLHHEIEFFLDNYKLLKDDKILPYYISQLYSHSAEPMERFMDLHHRELSDIEDMLLQLTHYFPEYYYSPKNNDATSQADHNRHKLFSTTNQNPEGARLTAIKEGIQPNDLQDKRTRDPRLV